MIEPLVLVIGAKYIAEIGLLVTGLLGALYMKFFWRRVVRRRILETGIAHSIEADVSPREFKDYEVH